MVASSHTAISYPQIASSGLADHNATQILEVFPYDDIPFQSCTPAELTRESLYCKAITISKNAKNMHYAGGATTESSLDIVVSSLLDKMLLLTGLMLMFGLLAFFRQLQQWKRGEPMDDDIEFNELINQMELRELQYIINRLISSGKVTKEEVEELAREFDQKYPNNT